jgi:hypothetical protein
MTESPQIMSLPESLHISNQERGILTILFANHLRGYEVFPFGSRATGKHLRRFSDLDLAVGQSLSTRQPAAFVDALDDSMLTFAFDLVELPLLDPDFRLRIEPDLLRIA